MNFLKKIDTKVLLVVFILLIVVFHNNKNIFNILNNFDSNLKNKNKETFTNIELPLLPPGTPIETGTPTETPKETPKETPTEDQTETDIDNTIIDSNNSKNQQNENMGELINSILQNLLEHSKNEIDQRYGNFSDIYMKLLNRKMKNINSQNKNLKLDLSNLLSLRESNHRRQVFLEVLLFNLVSKYKSLISELKKCNKENLDSNEQLKQTLYVNQLLQNKIQEITNEKENAVNESKVLNNIGKNYKYIKVGPKMYKELERLNLHKNIPSDMKKNIEKGLIHVLKV